MRHITQSILTGHRRIFLLYPETCGKTLEEIEVLFSKEGPAPWKTHRGESRLQAEIEAIERKGHGEQPHVMESEKAAAPTTTTNVAPPASQV